MSNPETRSIRPLLTLLALFVSLVLVHPQTGWAYEYVINGEPLPAEEAWVLAQAGLPAGEYWIDELGNFGAAGSLTPLFRIDEDGFMVEPTTTTAPAQPSPDMGAPLGPAGRSAASAPSTASPAGTKPEPRAAPSPAPEAAPPPPAPPAPGRTSGPVEGVDGTRVFWIQTSILSSSGASGYVHFCPGGRFYASSEGSFSVTGAGGWAGGAFDASSTGTWLLTRSEGEDWIEMRYEDGDTGGYWLADLTSGSSWRRGQWKYAAEPGRASCP